MLGGLMAWREAGGSLGGVGRGVQSPRTCTAGAKSRGAELEEGTVCSRIRVREIWVQMGGGWEAEEGFKGAGSSGALSPSTDSGGEWGQRGMQQCGGQELGRVEGGKLLCSLGLHWEWVSVGLCWGRVISPG